MAATQKVKNPIQVTFKKKLDIDLKHLTPSTRGKLQDLICKWKYVFSTRPTDLGYTRLVEHEINLNDDKPYREPYRRIPPSMFDEVREHLREILEIGAIRESPSPYSSSLVLVRTSDGSLRLCIDYRGVNRKITCIKDVHSLPRIDDTLDCLSGARFFT